MRRKKTHLEFLNEVENQVGNEYEVLSNYLGAKVKIKFRHQQCNKVFDMTPSDFLSCKNRCPHCYGIFRKSHDTFINEVFNLVGEEYVVLDEYKNNHTKVNFKHNLCNNVFPMIPKNFLNKNHRCPFCAGNNHKSNEEVSQIIEELTNGEYEKLSTYKNMLSKILMKHKICGYIWETTPNNFINKNSRCPNCNKSHGEEAIRLFFDKHNINYIRQFTFDSCKNINLLPFDFAVLNNNKVLELLIEYDGEHHYKPARYSRDKEKMLSKLKCTQNNDKIKNTYCQENNIHLLRIPYWEFDNIEAILRTEILIQEI